MFLRNCWYVAGWPYDLEPGKLLSVTIIGEPLVLFRKVDGTPVAFQDRCCHKSAKLSMGRLEGDHLRCMYHGLKFDTSGRCIEIPGQDNIPETACVNAYPVTQNGSWIWVWMGDPARADKALIPQTVAIDDPSWTLRRSQIDYNANYQLINDNLTDFSHLSFVHPNSFGASPTFAAVRPTVKRLERGVRISRWLGSPKATENANVAAAVGRNADAPVTYMSYDYLVPGILVMRSETFRVEDYPEDGVSAPTGTPVMANTNCQAVTPMTEDTSRYYFQTGPRSGPNSEKGAERLFEIMRIAFEEDRIMIESQATNMKLVSGQEMMTAHDLGPVQFRSIMRSLIKAETIGAAPLVAAAPATLSLERKSVPAE